MQNEQKFISLANFYNQMIEVMTAICVQKGGIPVENYVGRFFAADVLEFLSEYGAKINSKDPKILSMLEQFRAQAEQTKSLTTPSQKPIYEMSLAEFEKVMNI